MALWYIAVYLSTNLTSLILDSYLQANILAAMSRYTKLFVIVPLTLKKCCLCKKEKKVFCKKCNKTSNFSFVIYYEHIIHEQQGEL